MKGHVKAMKCYVGREQGKMHRLRVECGQTEDSSIAVNARRADNHSTNNFVFRFAVKSFARREWNKKEDISRAVSSSLAPSLMQVVHGADVSLSESRLFSAVDPMR